MNRWISEMFEEVAALLEHQGASPHRVRAWHEAAHAIREYDRNVSDVFRDYGRVGLEAIPHIGPKLAAAIIEVIRTGRCGALDRLRGEAQVDHLPGIDDEGGHDRPDVPPASVLLAIDREYRAAAAAGRLRRIAPRRFNPNHDAWLPILHVDRDGWSFTALFSNTARAHELGRTNDWVVIYFHKPELPEGQATVVTERVGRQRGQRVVRGREHECIAHWTDCEQRAS
jgi:hypothetical protein